MTGLANKMISSIFARFVRANWAIRLTCDTCSDTLLSGLMIICIMLIREKRDRWGILFTKLAYAKDFLRRLLLPWLAFRGFQSSGWKQGQGLSNGTLRKYVKHWMYHLKLFLMFRYSMKFAIGQSGENCAQFNNGNARSLCSASRARI